jgi:hypothetical protein
MPLPLSEFLPDELFYPQRKTDVINFLASRPAPSNVRRDWLTLWALWVGPYPSAADYRKVQQGAYDP